MKKLDRGITINLKPGTTLTPPIQVPGLFYFKRSGMMGGINSRFGMEGTRYRLKQVQKRKKFWDRIAIIAVMCFVSFWLGYAYRMAQLWGK